MAKEFHKEIVVLKNKVLEMGNFALEMLTDAVKALFEEDLELAKITVRKKHDIADYDSSIEEDTLKLIALYQPMAKDLRRLATILKTITYLTRIGRYGKDIAAVVKDIKNIRCPKRLVNLQHIFEHVRDMLIDVLKAFDKGNIDGLEKFGERDDEVDDLRWSIFRECITIMMEDPKCITPCAHYIMIARYLERCGDHACKIAEKVYYMVTGERTEIK